MKKKVVGIVLVIAVLIGGVWSMQAYHTSKVDHMRADGVAALKASVNMEDYGKKERKKIRRIRKADKEQIMRSENREEIADIAARLPGQIEGIPTIAERQEKGLGALKKQVSLKDYREEQQNEIKEIRKAAKKKIRKATEKKQIKRILRDTKAQIADIKTDAQLTAEEEAARQAELARQRAAAAAAAAAKRSSSSHKKKKHSGGCVGDDSKNFY